MEKITTTKPLNQNKMKLKAKFITGSWTNDDIDLFPTIKFRTGSKVNPDTQLKVTATSFALCWLRWGFMISFGKVNNLKSE